MAKKPRRLPRNLGQKLRQIRVELALSPVEIVRRLGFEDSLPVGRISDYEQGLREPSLLILLAYSRLAGVHLEEIVDDDIELPTGLPRRSHGLHRSLTRGRASG